MQPDQAINTRGFSVSRPILGWGPSAPGTYHAARTGVDGRLIYDVDYTIDNQLLRRTQSGPGDPTVAFFGDSFTFGQGLPDSETLPQIYADITGRKVHVLNFGFPGYGPQQFLRAIETGMFDPLLNNTKLFIYETGNWLIERSACRPGFMSRAPRYTLRDGTPFYQGACLEGWRRALSDIVSGSSLFSRFAGSITKPVSNADVELYIAEFARSAQLVKQKYGGRLIILYIPYVGPYLDKSAFTDARIQKRLRDAGLSVLDVYLTPKTFSPGTQLMIAGDGHPSATANRARALLLKDYLAKGPASNQGP